MTTATDPRTIATLLDCLPILDRVIRCEGNQIPYSTLAGLRADIYAALIRAGQPIPQEVPHD